MTNTLKIEWESKKASLSDLKPYEKNPRKISNEAFNKLKESIQQDGYHQRIIANTDYTVVGGHQRLKALKELGIKEVEVLMPKEKIPHEDFRRILVRDNLPFGEFDMDMLANDFEVDELVDWGMPEDWLPKTEEAINEPAGDEDEALEPPATPKTVRGDIYEIGCHRLMCGDSTLIDDVDKLMGGAKADMVFTDPPYGMNLDTDYSKIKGSLKSPNAKGYKWEKVIGDDRDFNPTQFIEMFKGAREQFWWGADYYFECLPRGGSLLVWQKRDKADADMIGNDFEICWSIQRHKKATFWKRWVGFDSVERGDIRVHPTQKPLSLAEWVFTEWGKDNDNIVDLFGGSGSTMVASHKLNRTAYLMELDEKYCDVIVTRMQKLFPDLPIKLNGEEIDWDAD